ncbi:MAG: hypothetical protein HOI79_05350, partial [Euryarchaeota archaeon]|nr:hypothetical protein [Euryarchaeota archaeon]
MTESLQRLVLVARDIELRVVSLIVRCREVAANVIVLDTGSNDETVELAQEVGCTVYHYNSDLSPQSIASFLQGHEETSGKTLILKVSRSWKLSDLPLSVNRAREPWDIHYTYKHESLIPQDDDDVVFASINFSLPDNVEKLYLTGAANFASGNEIGNSIYGS